MTALVEEDCVRAREEATTEREARERLARELAARAAEDAETTKQKVAEMRSTALDAEPYERPRAAPYVTTPGEGKYATSNFFGATLNRSPRGTSGAGRSTIKL